MASKQTEHYKLSQWEGSDAVLRADFNADNGKIDGALHTLAAGKAEKGEVTALGDQLSQKMDKSENLWVKVGELTSDAPASEVTVTVPNTEQYHQLMLHYTLSGPGTAFLLWAGSTPIVAFTDSNRMSLAVGRLDLTAAHGGGALLVYDAHTRDNSGVSRNKNGSSFLTECTFSGTVALGLRASNGVLAAGTHLDLYGMKK